MTPALHFKQFGRYEIIRKLGRSMTDVYLALDPALSRRVVLKLIEHSHDSYSQMVIDAERRGAIIQSQLHALDPRILEVYDYGEENGCFFVVMEYVEGQSLAELLRVEHRLDPHRAAQYAIEVCSELATLHSFQAEIDGRKRGVVHGDIKPANIQVTPDGAVRLLDFGIAKAITSTHSMTHHNLGSPAYCSPERLKTAQVDQHADLWALGVTLYEMVAGLAPYSAQSTRKLEGLIQSGRPPRALPESCPPRLKAVISKALAAGMERRYASVDEFQSDLKAFLNNRPTLAEAERLPSWDSNATLERTPPKRTSERRVPQVKLEGWMSELNRILWAVVAGLIIGLLLFIPAGYVYRAWTQTAPLRLPRDYAHRGIGDIAGDWQLFQFAKRQNRLPARFSPIEKAGQSLRASYLLAANEIIERYRNSSDPAVKDFDWAKAQVCLQHALELNPNDADARGKLALVNGYAELAKSDDPAASVVLSKADFERADALMPRSPDGHLGLARVYIYGLHNVGRAYAELHEAERLGFRPGPREWEQQADGFLYRAEEELRLWRSRRASASEQAHALLLAQRDLERARNLYEPISGFSDVSRNLQQVYRDEAEQRRLAAPHPKPKTHRRSHSRRNRHSRWR